MAHGPRPTIPSVRASNKRENCKNPSDRRFLFDARRGYHTTHQGVPSTFLFAEPRGPAHLAFLFFSGFGKHFGRFFWNFLLLVFRAVFCFPVSIFLCFFL
jgi:hypothetical protein